MGDQVLLRQDITTLPVDHEEMRTMVFSVIAVILLHGQSTNLQGRVPVTDSQIRRYAPDSFPQLPAAVRADLVRRGCLIPQLGISRDRVNVVRGHVFARSELDWAVLCSRNAASVILVYRPGRPNAPASIGQPEGDLNYLQSDGERGAPMIFSRGIDIVTPADMRRYAALSDEKLPFRPVHDGIEDNFVEKASSILYWNGRRWITLPGAD